MKLQSLKPRVGTIANRLSTVSSDSWRSTKTTGQRGYDYRWQKARERFLREHPLCVLCEAAGRVGLATIVDHKQPHRGDQALFWDEANWQGLCAHHHSSTKQREERKA